MCRYIYIYIHIHIIFKVSTNLTVSSIVNPISKVYEVDFY